MHNERVDFARSHANAQLGIGSTKSSDKAFENLLRKVGGAAKCLVNRLAKLAATDLRAANKALSHAPAASKTADEASQMSTNDADRGAAHVPDEPNAAASPKTASAADADAENATAAGVAAYNATDADHVDIGANRDTATVPPPKTPTLP